MMKARLAVMFGRQWVAAPAALLCLLVAGLSLPLGVAADNPEPYVEAVFELEDGRLVERRVCPLPPPFRSMSATASSLELVEAGGTLSDVPVFDWSNGCSATVAAMLFGYYDRTGYPDMYTGPANGGVCPLNNETEWASGVTPLSATTQGYDGLTVKGHVDDYWSQMGSSDDPYFGIWDEHGYADCTADFMGTNQYENWNNTDGSTTFFFPFDNSPLYDYSGSENGSTPRRDGSHGMRLFAESRGYDVVTNYNQRIEGYGGNAGGFSLSQFHQMIDSGQPVVIQVDGHSMLGVGYDSSSSTIYVHDTWDHDVHSMTWGGSYAGLGHYGVTVIELASTGDVPSTSTEAATSVEETTATLRGFITDDGGDPPCQWRFSYGIDSGLYDVSTAWTGSLGSGDGFQYGLTGLSKGQTYYFTAEARNGYGSSSGVERQFTTKPDAPSGLTATTLGTNSIELGWTAGDGAQRTRVQRKIGMPPTGPSDGTTVYFDTGGSVTDTALEPDTTYYFRAWSHIEGTDIWSDEYADVQAATESLPYPQVATDIATSITDVSGQLNGMLGDDGGETCDYRFEYDTDGGEPYALSTEWVTGVTTGKVFDTVVGTLDAGTTYCYRAQARNSVGTSSGEEMSFTTKPSVPSGLSASVLGSEAIDLSWTAGLGSTTTLVVRNTGGYPVDRTDGVQAYYGSEETYIDSGLRPGTTHYYRAWAYDLLGDKWSEGYSEVSAYTDGVVIGAPDVVTIPYGTVPVAITIDDAADLSNIEIVLSFDPNVVQLAAFESGDLGEVTHSILSDANATGQLTMSWSSGTGSTGDFIFGTLTVEGVGQAGESSLVDLTVTSLADSEATPLAHKVEDGSITLLTLMEGDVNGDFKTNIVDAMYVAQYTVGQRTLDPAGMISADTNDDGNVNIVDAMHIAQYTVDPTGAGGVLFKLLWESTDDEGLLPPS